MSPIDDEIRRARRFGWTSLCAWALVGLVLEGAQGFRVPFFVTDELARTLLRLGHAHGVGLSLVVLAFASNGVPLFAPDPAAVRSVGVRLRLASFMIPVGFALSAWRHPEGDPSIAVLSVPVGAVILVTALFAIARRAWRADR